MTHFRRLASWGPHLVLIFALAAAVVAGSCSSGDTTDRGRTTGLSTGVTGITGVTTGVTGTNTGVSGGVTAGMPPMIDGLTGLTVSVDNPAIALASYPGSGGTKVTVTGTFNDGSMRDVSSQVGLTVNPSSSAATIAGNTFSPTAPGVYTIVASANNTTSTATVTVTLTGSFQPPAVPPAMITALDGAIAGGGCTPTIAYPYNEAMFPLHMQSEFQISGAAQGYVRFHFSGSVLPDPGFTTYAQCTPIAGTNACSAIVPGEVANVLAGASTGDTMSVDVRLTTDGNCVGQSATPIDVRWSFVDVTGALYYWRTIPYASLNLCGLPDRTGIYRFDFDNPSMPPERYTANVQDIPMPVPTGACKENTNPPACVGCHAVTYNGDMISFAYNGSDVNQNGSRWALWTVATKQVLSDTSLPTNMPTGPFGNFTAFAPDGQTMVNALSGALTLHQVAQGLNSLGTVFGGVGEQVTHPYWSAPNGLKVAFTGYQASSNVNNNGDVVQGGEVWVGDSDGHMISSTPPTLVAAREPGVTKYYPAITDDEQWVIFNQSSCSGPAAPGTAPYGKGACDGYDDASARLMYTTISGGGTVPLDRANGTPTWANSWPRVSPVHGTFRKLPLYWVAFSSRRDFGVKIPGSVDGSSKPQLWITAVVPTLRGPAADPSFAPVWIPGQDDPDPANTGKFIVTGNHVPQWVKKFIPIKVN